MNYKSERVYQTLTLKHECIGWLRWWKTKTKWPQFSDCGPFSSLPKCCQKITPNNPIAHLIQSIIGQCYTYSTVVHDCITYRYKNLSSAEAVMWRIASLCDVNGNLKYCIKVCSSSISFDVYKMWLLGHFETFLLLVSFVEKLFDAVKDTHLSHRLC